MTTPKRTVLNVTSLKSDGKKPEESSQDSLSQMCSQTIPPTSTLDGPIQDGSQTIQNQPTISNPGNPIEALLKQMRADNASTL